MLIYRAILRPLSAVLTPWQADTLFGHFCWLIRHWEGEDALITFLDQYKNGRPSMVISSGFPGDYLPRPMLPSQKPAGHLPKHDQVESMRVTKANKDIRWVSLDDFNKIRLGQDVLLERVISLKAPQITLKNQINRLTGGTTAMVDDERSGNLYSVEELRYLDEYGAKQDALHISVYVKVQDQTQAERVEELFERLAEGGYGKKKSSGYGQFIVEGWEPFDGFDQPIPNANGFISLSNWVPSSGDPVDGFYNTLVKYGKLGEEFVTSENPFKFPLTMFTAGSSFYSNDSVRDWYGRMVENIAPANNAVVHYGYAFALPAELLMERKNVNSN